MSCYWIYSLDQCASYVPSYCKGDTRLKGRRASPSQLQSCCLSDLSERWQELCHAWSRCGRGGRRHPSYTHHRYQNYTLWEQILWNLCHKIGKLKSSIAGLMESMKTGSSDSAYCGVLFSFRHFLLPLLTCFSMTFPKLFTVPFFSVCTHCSSLNLINFFLHFLLSGVSILCAIQACKALWHWNCITGLYK